MRIVAGTFRGRRLLAPRGQEIRPTSDRVREAIFSIIGPAVAGARVLDLFAGTGALGLEALSRGAEEAVFVDQSVKAVRLIRSNAELCGVLGRVSIVHEPINQALRRLGGRGKTFDLVFMDPPYGKGFVQKTLSDLAGVARDETLVVAEQGARDLLPPPLEEQDWLRVQERKYGDTVVSFFVRKLAH
jgi:16S rRNA (guanine(966)-N(2))-methyltransferase RsmD